jgi:glucan endo-1,3-alpha-glucosidase
MRRLVFACVVAGFLFVGLTGLSSGGKPCKPVDRKIGGVRACPPVPPPVPPPASKLVFSWYMTPFYTYSTYGASDASAIAGYRHDIQDAQAAGIDGFTLYVGGAQYMFDNVRNMLEAAKELHDANPSTPPFWLYLSPEAACDTCVSALEPGTNTNWIVYFMQAFASHPNYFHFQGKPVLMPFLGLRVAGGVNQQADWVNSVFTPLHNQGIDVSFVPSTFNTNDVTTVNGQGQHTMTLTPWGQTNLAGLNVWTGNTPTNDINGGNYMANVAQLNGKPYIGGVAASHYWSVNNSPSSHVYFEHYGGEGPAQSWANAIQNQNPAWIVETTWNDYAETYSNPAPPATVLANGGTGYGIESLLKPHAGYTELGKYYRAWYKTGQAPIVTRDELLYFYRTHAKNLIASNDNTVQNFNPGAPNDTVPDDLFVTTELTAPATLRVTSGGVVTTYNVAAGVQFTRIPFQAGSQTFEVIRGGSTIISTSGEPILSSIQKYNFIPTSGFAYGR